MALSACTPTPEPSPSPEPTTLGSFWNWSGTQGPDIGWVEYGVLIVAPDDYDRFHLAMLGKLPPDTGEPPNLHSLYVVLPEESLEEFGIIALGDSLGQFDADIDPGIYTVCILEQDATQLAVVGCDTGNLGTDHMNIGRAEIYVMIKDPRREELEMG